MKVLISPVSLDEARVVVAGGVDIVDVKNVKEGSLGAQCPWVVKSITDEFAGHDVVCSVAIGDLPNKPGTIALAAYGAACCGAGYIKAGMYAATCYDEAFAMSDAFVKAVRMGGDGILAVVAGYADYARFGGVNHLDIVRAARDAGADVVMLDTSIKDGKTLRDALTADQISEFIGEAHKAGMITALAGSVKAEDVKFLYDLGADIVGIRGAVCDASDRTLGITEPRVKEFVARVRELAA